MANPFKVVGGLVVQDSATVLCVRHVPLAAPASLTRQDVGNSAMYERGVFSKDGTLEFRSGWEVLMAQAVVINWMRSTAQKLTSMRYAGEYKIPGGNVDAGETIEAAAKRELAEEILRPAGMRLPDEAVLRPFTTKQTRPIRSTSNLIHCFAALESENAWLSSLDLDSINAGLQKRHAMFQEVMGKDPQAFWSLPKDEKELLSPETNEVRWVPLHEAVKCSLSSMASPVVFVNEYQREHFGRMQKKQRDPMFITAAVLMELEGFPTIATLVRHCQSADLPRLTAEEQWLFPGMTDKEVGAAFKTRVTDSKTGVNPSFKGNDLIQKLREERLALDRISKL